MILLHDRQYIFHIPEFLNSEEIDLIHKHVENIPSTEGSISTKSQTTNVVPEFAPDKEVRDSTVKWIGFDQEIKWFWIKLIEVINGVNHDFFHFDIGSCNAVQYGTYPSPGGKYKSHIDTIDYSYPQRKISFSIQLTDENEYEGGDLLIYNNNIQEPYKASRKKGSITIFFSMFIHEVTPVTSGTRQSLVSWVLGPPLK